MEETSRLAVIEALRQVVDREVIPNGGLCHYIQEAYFGDLCSDVPHMERLVLGDKLRKLFKEWPEFSGDTLCPVPHPHLAPHTAFIASYPQRSLYEGEYGERRVRLAKYLMEELCKFRGRG